MIDEEENTFKESDYEEPDPMSMNDKEIEPQWIPVKEKDSEGNSEE